MKKMWMVFAALVAFLPSVLMAAESHGGEGGHGELIHFTTVFGFVVIMYLFARMGAIVERWGFPSVLGELSAGILFANAALAFNLPGVASLRDDELVKIFPFVGVILLLFKCGLEEQLKKMMQVGGRAFLVALIGMAFPGVAGYFLASWLLPDANSLVHIFFGATLVATSVGITAKIFSDLGYTGRTKSLVIGAAVIDDVGGLVVLAVVVAMAAGGQVSALMIGKTIGISTLFLAGSIAIGYFSAPLIGRFLSRIHTGVGMKTGMALAFCAAFSYAAVTLAGLEPIVGAFAAGLVLEAVHFRSFTDSYQVIRIRSWMDQLEPHQHALREQMEKQLHDKEHGHVESLIEGFARFFVPVFFVHTGMGVDLRAFASLNALLIAAALSVVAILGKLACGLVAGKDANRWITGWAMVARGEVGLVFASIALANNIFGPTEFAVATIVVVITTFVPPLLLPRLVRKEQEKNSMTASVTVTPVTPEPVLAEH